MLALSVTDIKDFMNQLLIGETFDHFSLIEASIVTFNTFTIDGKLQKDFFDTDTLEAFTENAMEYSLWHDVKPFCFSVIRGKRTPVSFKIVFRLPLKKMQVMLEQAIPDLPSDALGGLYLNLQYKNKCFCAPPVFLSGLFFLTNVLNNSGTALSLISCTNTKFLSSRCNLLHVISAPCTVVGAPPAYDTGNKQEYREIRCL